MAAIRYENTFYSNNGIKYTIQIYDADYSSTKLDCEVSGLKKIVPHESSERFNPILTTSYNLELQNTTVNNLDQLITDIKASDEERFALLVFKDDAFEWCGWSVLDIMEIDDVSKPYPVSLNFSDGLNRMQTRMFATSDIFAKKGNIPSTFEVENYVVPLYKDFIELLLYCLDITGLLDFWDSAYITDTIVLTTGVDWYENEMPARAQAVDPLYYSRIKSGMFYYTDEELNLQAKTVYEVLEQVCICWGARLFQSDGKWNFIQINEYNPTTTWLRNWNKAGSKVSDSNTNLTNSVDKINRALIATASNTYYPALRRVEIPVHNANEGAINPISAPDDVWGDWLDCGEIADDDAVLLMFSVYEYFFYNPLTDYRGWRGRLKISLRIDAGTPVVYYQDLILFDIFSNSYKHQVIDYSLVTAPFTTGGLLEIKYEFDGCYKLTTLISTSSNYTYEMRSFNAFIVRSNEAITSQTVIAFNQDSASADLPNSYIYETKKLFIGSNDIGNIGAIETTADRSTWTRTNLWGAQGETKNRTVNRLLAQEILAGQRVICPIIQGEVIGDNSMLESLTYDSLKWILSGGTYNCATDTWSGVWFKVGRSITYIDFSEGTKLNKLDSSKLGNLAGEICKLQALISSDEGGEVINIEGGFSFTFLSFVGDGTLTVADSKNVILLDGGADPIDLEFPDTVLNGLTYQIKCTNADNTVRLLPNSSGSDTVDGAASYALAVGDAVKFIYNLATTNWIKL